MKYSLMLKNSILKSEISLSDLAEELRTLGQKTNKAYISKLQNGKLPPAGDKLNEALAEVLKIDPIDLKAAAYREKIPPEVLARLSRRGVS